MTRIEQHTARDGSTFWTASGGNIAAVRYDRADLDAVLATGDRSIGIAPPMADWPAEYVADMQARLGLAPHGERRDLIEVLEATGYDLTADGDWRGTMTMADLREAVAMVEAS